MSAAVCGTRSSASLVMRCGMPERCCSSMPTVMLSPLGKSRIHLEIGSAMASLPSSSIGMATATVIGLVIEAMLKRVADVFRCLRSASAQPHERSSSTWSRCMTSRLPESRPASTKGLAHASRSCSILRGSTAALPVAGSAASAHTTSVRSRRRTRSSYMAGPREVGGRRVGSGRGLDRILGHVALPERWGDGGQEPAHAHPAPSAPP